MDLLNFFQFLQALLAIFVVLCLCTKGPVKHHCHVALVVLVISMMIIPPFGRNFLSAASMKEGATTHTTGGYKPTHTTGGYNPPEITMGELCGLATTKPKDYDENQKLLVKTLAMVEITPEEIPTMSTKEFIARTLLPEQCHPSA
jgi:hypothetical protein